MMRLPYAYCVRSPRYRTTYYRTSLGAYNRAVAMLRSDDEITEPTRDYGYDDGLGIWQRTPEGGWQFDHITTATAWGNVAPGAHNTTAHPGGPDEWPHASCSCGWMGGAQFEVDQAAESAASHVKSVDKPIYRQPGAA